MIVSVHPEQLVLDLDALTRLVERLRETRRIDTGAERLLVALVASGLDERALTSAAALVLEMEEMATA